MCRILYLIILYSFLAHIDKGLAQNFNTKNKKAVLDTISIYLCETQIITTSNQTVYKVDGKEVSKQEFELISRSQQDKKKCNPCYLKSLDKNGTVISEGTYYYN